MAKLIFYSPFPSFSKKEAYELVANSVTKKEGVYLGLPMHFDPDAKAASWNGYFKHLAELNDFKAVHMDHFKKRLVKKSVVCDILDISFPTQNNSKLFKDFTPEDILFIHCHGNTQVIGTGGFTLTPKMLAEHLEILQLPKSSPPVVVVWACNSATTNALNEKSYAEELRGFLSQKGYTNIAVMGVSAKIIIHRATKDDPVTFFRKEAEKVLKEYQAIEVFHTPTRQQDFPRTAGILERAAAVQEFYRTREQSIAEAAQTADSPTNPQHATESLTSPAPLTTEFSNQRKRKADALQETPPQTASADPISTRTRQRRN